MRKSPVLLIWVSLATFVFGISAFAADPLPTSKVRFRIGPSAAGQCAVNSSTTIYAYPGSPGKYTDVQFGVFARKWEPANPNVQDLPLPIQGFDVAVKVTGNGLFNYGAGTPSTTGEPECPSEDTLPCLIPDVGLSNIVAYEAFSPDHPAWVTTGQDAAIAAGFRIDYELPPNRNTPTDAEVEIATFHYGIPVVTPPQTYNVNLPNGAATVPEGVVITNAPLTDTIYNSVKIGGKDFSPAVLTGATIQVIKNPSDQAPITLVSAALATVDGTQVCLRWTVETGQPNAGWWQPFGFHVYRDGQDVAQVAIEAAPPAVYSLTLKDFDFCDFTQTNVYTVGFYAKDNPNDDDTCGMPPGQIVHSNRLAVTRVPLLLEDISPDNVPYFAPLTELTVKTKYAFNSDCGNPVDYAGPYTATGAVMGGGASTACTPGSEVITAGTTDTNLCPTYNTGALIGSSLWKLEVSCSDANPFAAGDQPYRFIYDGLQGRADTRYVDANTVEIWCPTGCNGTAASFAQLPSFAHPDPHAALVHPIPSVYRVALVVVRAGAVVARSQSFPLNFGFRRGDTNLNGTVTLADVVNMIVYFGTAGNGAMRALNCACDTNDSQSFTLSDVIYLMNYVVGGPEPPLPFAMGGVRYFGMDPSGDAPRRLSIGSVIFQCAHYCPCFKTEIREAPAGYGADPAAAALGGNTQAQTTSGCCVCRQAHVETDATGNPVEPDSTGSYKYCNMLKYAP